MVRSQSLVPTSVLVQISISVSRHHDRINSHIGKLLSGASLQFRVQSIIIMVGHGSMQADVMLKKEMRLLHFDPQSTEGDCASHWT